MDNIVQNEYNPDVVSPPGETLQEILEDRGMAQAELARRSGRPAKTINEIVKGKTEITPETALQLELVLGVPASFWLRREQLYRESLARTEERTHLAKHLGWLDQIPYQEMISKCWIRHFPDTLAQLKEVLRFFGITSPEQWDSVVPPQVSFRQSQARPINEAAVVAWLRQGELLAHELECEPYDETKFRKSLTEIRSLTLETPDVFVPLLRSKCAASGVAVIFVPQLKNTGISGATRWLTSNKALIQLSLRYKKNDSLWFSFFHEAGHILLHGKREVFLEPEGQGESNHKEKEADTFAADFLIPPNNMERIKEKIQLSDLHISLDDIRAFADEIGVAPGIVVGRLQHDHLMPFTHGNHLKVSLKWSGVFDPC